jgi:citronellol/citronellal dehydrogenase
MAKFGMSMCVLGMAAEFRDKGVAFNALWPRTAIATAAVEFAITGPEGLKSCRTTDILADAAHVILTRPAKEHTGNFYIDDVLLYDAGVRDFDQYRVDPARHLLPDFFVPDDTPVPPGVSMLPVCKEGVA